MFALLPRTIAKDAAYSARETASSGRFLYNQDCILTGCNQVCIRNFCERCWILVRTGRQPAWRFQAPGIDPRGAILQRWQRAGLRINSDSFRFGATASSMKTSRITNRPEPPVLGGTLLSLNKLPCFFKHRKLALVQGAPTPGCLARKDFDSQHHVTLVGNPAYVLTHSSRHQRL